LNFGDLVLRFFEHRVTLWKATNLLFHFLLELVVLREILNGSTNAHMQEL
jgi:hypothetical protein